MSRSHQKRKTELHNRLIAFIIAVICAAALVRPTFAQPNREEQAIKITIGSKNFIAILDDNATAAAFRALMPMTVEMTELNGNEKYVRLPGNLPTKVANPGTIKTGDLMIYGSTTVVLFYKTFPTSYE